MKASLATWASVLCLVTGTATAANTGMFFDVSAGQSIVEDTHKDTLDGVVASVGTLNSSTVDDIGAYWAAAIGYKFLPYLAADIGWTHIGSLDYKANFTFNGQENRYKVTVKSGGPTVGVTGILPIGKRIELRARGGVIFSNASVSEYVSNASLSSVNSSDDRSTEFFVNIAAAFKFTPTFSVYVSAHRFNKVGTDVTGESNINGASLGVTFSQ